MGRCGSMENLRKSKYLKWIVGALGLVAIVAVSIGGYQWYIEREKANITQNYNIDTVVPQLQEISGDMTYQIRNFALTGDVEFLRTYWDCVFIEGGRDVVLKPLEQLVIQGEETKELEELKKTQREEPKLPPGLIMKDNAFGKAAYEMLITGRISAETL